MELHLALKQIVDTEGKSVLKEQRLINILSDLHAFETIPSSKYIISCMLKDGYLNQLISFNDWDINVKKNLNNFIQTTGFNKLYAEKVWQSIAFSLGWVNNVQDSDQNHDNILETYIDDTPLETFEKSKVFMRNIYSFVDNLSNDSVFEKHANSLNGVKVEWPFGQYSDDADTETYRGRLFSVVLIDLFRILLEINKNISVFTPQCYPFTLFISRVCANVNIEYSQLSDSVGLYEVIINNLLNFNNLIPKPDEFFLLFVVFNNYEKELSLKKNYFCLINNYIEIMKEAVHSSKSKRQLINYFINKLDCFDKSNNII